MADFKLEEALPLAEGLGARAGGEKEALSWVFKWTGGHPYLTQRLCRVIAQEYAGLVRAVRDNGVKAVFGEVGFSDRFVSQLAADTQATYVADLYTDTLSEGPPADTYLNQMKATTEAIVNGLK